MSMHVLRPEFFWESPFDSKGLSAFSSLSFLYPERSNRIRPWKLKKHYSANSWSAVAMQLD